MSDCTKENCPLVDPGNCRVETCKWKTGGYSMSNLISRQAAIDVTWEEPSYTDPLNILTEVRDRIKALPSAQPVIRCKDCKNCEMGAITAQYSDGSVKVENLCHRNKWSVRGTDYCSYAEPKE